MASIFSFQSTVVSFQSIRERERNVVDIEGRCNNLRTEMKRPVRESNGATVRRKHARELLGSQNSLFRGFCDAELHDGFRRDLNLFSRSRITANTGFSVHEHEFSDTWKGKGVFGFSIRQLRDFFENAHGSFFLELKFARNVCGNLAL